METEKMIGQKNQMVSSNSLATLKQAKNSPGHSGPGGSQRGVDQFRDMAIPLKRSKKGKNHCQLPDPSKEIPNLDFLRRSPLVAPTCHLSPAVGSSNVTRSTSSCCSHEVEKAREWVRKALETYDHMVEVLKRSRTPRTPLGLYKEAVDVLSRRGACVNTDKRLGGVPGVEVGQSFQHWGELMVVGLHHPYRRGIATIKHNGIDLATSIVATNLKENLVTMERILYVGEGGMPYNCHDSKLAKDQKLSGGNLALKNSMKMSQPVRVICQLPSKSSVARYVYVYCGIYLAEKMTEVTSVHGKLVFQFEMRRVLGQPDLSGIRRLQAK